MNAEHSSHLFDHREVPDIRDHDMHLDTEFQRQQKFLTNPNSEECRKYEQYDWMAYCSLNHFLPLSKREFPPKTSTEAVGKIVAMVSGASWSDQDPVTKSHINWFAGFGMTIGTSALPFDESQSPTIRGIHIGAIARLLEVADISYRKLCALSIQQGYRTQGLCHSGWTPTWL
jgi:hypothetical protein